MELDYAEIGIRIARRRRSFGLKQVELCEQLGISDKHLSCIERAAVTPSLDILMRLVQALDTTPDELLLGRPRRYSDRWWDVAEMLQNLNPAQLELARDFFHWLKNAEIPLPVENGGPPSESD